MTAKKWGAAAALMIVVPCLSVYAALSLVCAPQAYALEADGAPAAGDGLGATEATRDGLSRLEQQLELYAASENNLRSRLAAQRRHADTALAVLTRVSLGMRAADQSDAPDAMLEAVDAAGLAAGAYRMASRRGQALERALAELAIAKSLARGRREVMLAGRAGPTGDQLSGGVGMTLPGGSTAQDDPITLSVKAPRSRPAARYTSFANAKGRIRLPVDGDIIAGFGDVTKTGLKSRGLVLEVPPDARVTAPFAGRIRFAGAFRDYGHVLIIDHGDGYHSLLAGLGRIDASVDRRVTGGEQVGAMAGTSTEMPTLLFELWRERLPVNPLPWVRVFTVKENR